MYSGFAITRFSGRVMGAHQQIDRLARRRLSELLNGDNSAFPSYREIVRFEGRDGPDGIKLKSPARDEPWHYLSPFDKDNHTYEEMINYHYKLLVRSLKTSNQERAAFEAAWLAHTIVDGMTPAHHYPYEKELDEMLNGNGRSGRDSKFKKMVFKGDTPSETAKNMYKVYGPKGLYTAHHMFEFGVMLLLRPLRLPDARPSSRDMNRINNMKPSEYFLQSAREIAALDLYNEYLQKGWTTRLSNKIRHQLGPIIVRTVALMWYKAAIEAGICE